MASRMGLISVAYIQQDLYSLLNSINYDQGNMDSITQSLRDTFFNGNKIVRPSRSTGAFHHLIGRKAAAKDSGLITLKDILNKLVYLPLTAFEKTLEEKLKERKEQKDSFKDLIPEWNDRGLKKNFTNSNKSNFKRQIVTTNSISNGKTNYQRPSFNRSADYRLRDEYARGATTASNTMSDRTSSFRIPTKSNK